MSDTPPFDMSLYDAVMAEADSHAPTSEGMPNVHQRHIFTEWYDGWDTCAEVAARISSERQPVPVIPGHVHRFTVRPVGDKWWCWATQDIDATEAHSWVGKGNDPFAAMTAAIDAAKESEHD